MTHYGTNEELFEACERAAVLFMGRVYYNRFFVGLPGMEDGDEIEVVIRLKRPSKERKIEDWMVVGGYV